MATGGERALLRRLGGYQRHGVGLPDEADLDDLDPAEMESWTPEQIDRANFSGFLALLGREQWPRSVREGDGSNGNCHLCQLYQRYFPHPEEAKATRGAGQSDEDHETRRRCFGLAGDDDAREE